MHTSEGVDDMILDISLTDDDPGSGSMVSVATIKGEGTKQPSAYDDYASTIDMQYTAEMFDNSENRVPRFTVQESRDLVKRKSR
jgi:hypothetical protein